LKEQQEINKEVLL